MKHVICCQHLANELVHKIRGGWKQAFNCPVAEFYYIYTWTTLLTHTNTGVRKRDELMYVIMRGGIKEKKEHFQLKKKKQ